MNKDYIYDKISQMKAESKDQVYRPRKRDSSSSSERPSVTRLVDRGERDERRARFKGVVRDNEYVEIFDASTLSNVTKMRNDMK